MLEIPDIPLNRRQVLALLAATAATTLSPPTEARNDAGAQLKAITEGYFDALLDTDPMWASQIGLANAQQAARLANDISPEHRNRLAALRRNTLASLRGVARGQLGDADLVAYDALEFHLEDLLALNRFPDHLLPIGQLGDAVPFNLAGAADNGLCPFATKADYEHHLARLQLLPAWCEQAVKNYREGLRRGIVHPRPIVERVLGMLREVAEPAADKSPYYEPIRRLPASLAEADRDALAQAYRQAIERVVAPAVARLADVVQREVLPQARSSAGWSALPDGRAWYEQWVRSNISTTMSPDEIHALGLREVQRLRGKMAEVQAHYGYQGSLAEFLVWHRERPEARPFKTEQEVLDAYAALNRRIIEQLPRLFGRAPKAPLEIRPEPELTRNTASDHYNSPAPDGSRPGIYFAVITDAATYNAPRMASLFLHEGQPGHHFQLALAQELPITRLQRFYFYNAFGEGWALYAETLGYDLGLYDDPSYHLGHLSMAMLRAVRLVVDTGMHAKGWSRERSIAYFMEQTGFDERDSRAQIERYMVWPGQALGYSIGRIKIESLRDRARERLGKKFSLADFHDQVIGSGSLPLSVLEAKIARWTDTVMKG